jgi:adenosylcobinamide-GDP ribazoletransferase
VAPVVARATPALLARLFPAARREGQGATFVANVPRASWAATLLVAALAAAGALGVPGLVAALTALVVALAVARFLCGRLGGVTGDVLGATVETTELVFILGVLAWIRAGR